MEYNYTLQDYGSPLTQEMADITYLCDKITEPRLVKENYPPLAAFEVLKKWVTEMYCLPFVSHKRIVELERIIYTLKDNFLMVHTKASLLAANKNKYYDPEYRQLRDLTISLYGKECMVCYSDENIQLDHIKPVSKRPDLFLDAQNMQVLCKRCNEKKSNKNDNDYRPY